MCGIRRRGGKNGRSDKTLATLPHRNAVLIWLLAGLRAHERSVLLLVRAFPCRNTVALCETSTRLPLRGQHRVCSIFEEENAPVSRFIPRAKAVGTPEATFAKNLITSWRELSRTGIRPTDKSLSFFFSASVRLCGYKFFVRCSRKED